VRERERAHCHVFIPSDRQRPSRLCFTHRNASPNAYTDVDVGDSIIDRSFFSWSRGVEKSSNFWCRKWSNKRLKFLFHNHVMIETINFVRQLPWCSHRNECV